MNVDNEINNDLNNKHQNGKIYIIYSLISSKVYFGSTINKIDRRFKKHIYYYNGYKKGKYKCCYGICDMFDELDVNNCKIKLIKNYSCNSRKALELEEGKFIQSSKQCYNKNVAGRSKKEWNKKYRADNVEKNKQYKKIYRENNEKTLKQKINCECGGKYTFENKARHFRTLKHLDYLKIKEQQK